MTMLLTLLLREPNEIRSSLCFLTAGKLQLLQLYPMLAEAKYTLLLILLFQGSQVDCKSTAILWQAINFQQGCETCGHKARCRFSGPCAS